MLALIVPALILFATFKSCRPLIAVILACAVLNTPVVVVPDTVRLLAKMLPLTVNPVRLPRLVILFKVLGASVPLKVPPSIVPGTVKLLMIPLKALMLPALTDPAVDSPPASIPPVTVRRVNVPSVVILGW